MNQEQKPSSSNEDKKTEKGKTNAAREYDRLTREADEERKEKKPGSQANGSDTHNNGRGGGK